MTDRKEPTDRDEIEKLAEMFHETYERLAPQYGYTTRKGSAVSWEYVPGKNKKLMLAVCEEILANFVPRTEHERIVEELTQWETGERELA